jgi:hypothetical protein
MLIQKQLKQLYIFNRKCKNKKKMGITEKYCENTYIAKEVGSLLRRVFNHQIKAYIIESGLQIKNLHIKQRRIANPPQRREHPSRRASDASGTSDATGPPQWREHPPLRESFNH